MSTDDTSYEYIIFKFCITITIAVLYNTQKQVIFVNEKREIVTNLALFGGSFWVDKALMFCIYILVR